MDLKLTGKVALVTGTGIGFREKISLENIAFVVLQCFQPGSQCDEQRCLFIATSAYGTGLLSQP